MRIVTIRPDSRSGESTLDALRHLVQEIWSFRGHIKIVFKEQFRAAYQGSGLGVFWNYALPIVPLTVYLWLSHIRVFPAFEGVDGTTFIAFGVTLWFFLSGCVQTPIATIAARNQEVMKTAFPLSAAILSAFAKLVFDTLVRLGFVALIILISMKPPAPTALLLPLALVPATLLFLGVGLLFGLLNVIYKDVGRVINIFLQYGLFVSGVIFPMPHFGVIGTLSLFNPFAVFIEAARGIVFRGGIDDPLPLAIWSVVAVLVFLLTTRVFYVMEYRIRGIS